MALFGAVKLTEKADYYCGYHIGLHWRWSFSVSDNSGFNKNVVIVGADMNSSLHIDNKKRNILILGKVPTDALKNTTLAVEKESSITFTEQQKNFCLSLNYNGMDKYIFVNGIEI